MSAFVSLSSCCLVLFLCQSAFAAQIEGHLHRDRSGVSIHLSADHKIYKVVALTTEVQEIVERLAIYDFIRGSGEIRSDQVILEAVDFVGLKGLLGSWNLLDGTFLTFRNFLKASYTDPSKIENYTYSLAPGEGKPWRILMSNGSWVSVGYLEVSKDKLKIQFVDLKTGHLKKPIELTRKAP